MKKGKSASWLIVGLLMGLVIGGLGGYFVASTFHKNGAPARGNFQIDDSAKNEVSSIFTSSDTTQINSYCEQNRMNCAYYCRMNSGNEICKQLNFTMGGRQWSQ